MITVEFLGAWALRSSILILSGVVLLKALRVKDPSVRLAAWTAMLIGSLAIPLLTVSLPAVPVRTAPVAVPLTAIYTPAAGPVATALQTEMTTVPSAKHFDWARAAVIIYAAIASILILRLCFGLAMSLHLRYRSWPTELPGVRESGRVESPVTLGIVRPVILLPTDWREWDPSKLDAVLAHERSHIRRRDPAVQVLSAIHRALLWYSPLSWYLDRQIVSLAEEASDDAAIAVVRDRASYAETLLEFMRGAERHPNWQGVPMARYGQPERRLHRILDSTVLSRGITRWSIATIIALGLPLAYVIAAAQERLTFDAASVKLTTLPAGVGVAGGAVFNMGDLAPKGGPGTGDPGRIHYPLITLTGLLNRAYKGHFDITAPDWADNALMAVDATMPPNTTKEQFQTMLQNLLIDRFALKTHIETKEITGYALTVAKDGPKFQESRPDDEPEDPNYKDHMGPDGFPARPPHMRGIARMFGAGERFRMAAGHATMAAIAKELGQLLASTVKDRTGLKGAYDLTLTFAGHPTGAHLGGALMEPPPPATDPGAPEPLPDIFSALQSQLGLKLEKQKVSVEILVVDHIEKTPVGN